ncbi:hypothetical protein [Mucilaginibacter auburnensis]|uniref:ZU5 domain-containing protein n=1 Tax=Mucilaginibacter auburnensis TaxID=1457233 RepID=A0A2H9VS01_9SPHI|nr:hypothetical protein [Mucilaginibacter auburnensis]PJJ83606.1 hypothetical protein CLV57_0592 [Mucilaginibacter auburnensis]
MNLHYKKFYLLLLITALFTACKKQSATPGPKPNDEVVYRGFEKVEHGLPVGEKTQATIGPTGGTLSTPNNTLQLTIPAGAIDDNIAFSVQEVKNTMAAGGIGKSYRLLPEDVQFKKDVEISMNISDTTGLVLATDWMYLAYQDKHGYWHCAKNSVFDPATYTMKAKTRHFSDWSLMQTFKIKNTGKDELDKGESAALQLEVVQPASNPDEPTIDDLLGPSITLDESNIAGWHLLFDGPAARIGTLSASGMKATFKAPTADDRLTQGGVYVDLKNLSIFKDPNRPTRGQSLRVSYNVFVELEQYAKLTLDNTGGITRSVKDISVQVAADGKSKLDFNMNGNLLNIELPNMNMGLKPYGDKQAFVTFLVYWGSYYEKYTSYYAPCGQSGYSHVAGGVELKPDRDGMIKGTFSGYLRHWINGECATVPIPVKATFRVKKP